MKSNIEGITEQNHLRLKNPIKRKRHPDEIKDRENYRRMKGIPVPNYTINKGTLAENMGGNVSTARVLAIGPLKTLGMYRTWQEDWKNYSGKDWWGAQGINLGVPIISKIERGMALSVATIDLTDSPFLGAVISIAGVIATNEAESSAVKETKEKLLKTDNQKKEDERNIQKDIAGGKKQ